MRYVLSSHRVSPKSLSDHRFTHASMRSQRRIRFAMLELVFTGTAGSSRSELFLTIPTVRAATFPISPSCSFFSFAHHPLRAPSRATFRLQQKSEHCSVRPDRKKGGGGGVASSPTCRPLFFSPPVVSPSNFFFYTLFLRATCAHKRLVDFQTSFVNKMRVFPRRINLFYARWICCELS